MFSVELLPLGKMWESELLKIMKNNEKCDGKLNLRISGNTGYDRDI